MYGTSPVSPKQSDTMHASWTVLVEEDLQHNACILMTWGGDETPIAFAGRHNDVCLAWSAFSSF